MADRVRTLDAFINASTGLFRSGRGISAQDVRDLIASIVPALRGSIHGLTLANNASDATNDIDIATGSAWDNTDDVPLVLTSPLTKRLDAGHSAGTNAGGLDTGSKANSTTYHLHLVGRSDTAAIDACFSTSAATPSLASAWDWNRRIGSLMTTSGGAIRPFTQRGDLFRWKTPEIDANGTLVGTTASLFALTVPAGIQVEPVLGACFGLVGGSTIAFYVSSPDQDDVAVAIPNAWTHASLGTTDAAAPVGENYRLLTNTSRQIRIRSNTASTAIYIGTSGWIDTRGQVA